MYQIIRFLMFPVFHLYLKPKIIRNYRLRAVTAIFKRHGVDYVASDGSRYPDEWYWADDLAASYGYFVPFNPGVDSWIIRSLAYIRG